MPELRCTVQTCTHNKQFYCALDKIVVEGNTAEKSQDTCCGSFEERKGNSYSNVTGEASPLSSIDCKAQECVYNNDCRCEAGKISVEGSDACQCQETECASFRCSHK
ncbi:MAG: DUF1540 domain-containing protein [Lachnospiraceae bacterium]|nr:DUF1540 domain-containing protein [Lachnospiraceae bacterium]